jgi:ATP-dependent exoDNAse (exonuclease V) beta subunit
MRLLYVATTRSRERLHLVAQLAEKSAMPQTGSLLTHLWPQARPYFDVASDTVAEGSAEPVWIVPPLRRLRGRRREPAAVAEDAQNPGPEFLWVSHAAVQVGTIVHEVLNEIAVDGVDHWTRERVDGLRRRFRSRLVLLGVEEFELDRAVQRIIDALCAVLQDPQGRWVLSDHTEAASEMSITLSTARGLEHLRIDRTFVDESGLRWIVDFKTSQHTGGAIEAFLDSEAQRYQFQLTRYADAMARLDDRPIRVALYFPLLQAFRAWDHEPRRGGSRAGRLEDSSQGA